MSSESLKRSRSNVSPVNEGDIDKRPCIDTLHESFSSLGDSDTAYNETTILEPDSESEVCRLHSTVLDPAGSDDLDQSRQEMSIRDSLKEALKDPAEQRHHHHQRHHVFPQRRDPHPARGPGEEGGGDRGTAGPRRLA